MKKIVYIKRDINKPGYCAWSNCPKHDDEEIGCGECPAVNIDTPVTKEEAIEWWMDQGYEVV